MRMAPGRPRTKQGVYYAALRVQELRERRGWSIEDVAERTGLHRITLSRIERGLTMPRRQNLQLFAELFECDVSELFHGRERLAA